MSEVAVEGVPALLLEIVPETAEFIAERYGVPAERAVRTEEAVLDLYPILLDCLWRSVIRPQLDAPAPDAELLGRCFAFVERVVDHPSEHVGGAVYFNVLESLLDAEGYVETAFPHMRKRTRESTIRMLDSYETVVPGVNDTWRRRS